MSQPSAVLHCNAGGAFGMGHLMRVLAVAEEAISRGWTVTVAGDLDERAQSLVAQQCPAATCVRVDVADAPRWLATATDPSVAVVHLDSYWIESAELLLGRHLVSSIQDGVFGQRTADLAIDPNLGAERRLADRESGHYLLGIDAVAIRRQVLRQRGVVAASGRRILVVLGGTDAQGATAQLLQALGALRAPVDVTVVAPASVATEVAAAASASPHAVSVVPFLDDLPAVARDHDLVITAAGTSVWDFACLGVPMAVVWVAENQRVGYEAVVDRGLGVGLGRAPGPGLAERMSALGELLDDPARLGAMAATGRALVDGLGTWRIVSAWEQLLTVEPQASPRPLSARPATMADAAALFSWRNDAATRASSRTTEELLWESHVAWLTSTISRSDRELLVVEEGGHAIGTVRWDVEGDDTWEVSVTVDPGARGRRLGLAVLQAGERALRAPGPVRLLATVREDNAGSRRLFARAGYLPHLPADDDGFLTFARWRLE